jgi:hypothetical protein
LREMTYNQPGAARGHTVAGSSVSNNLWAFDVQKELSVVCPVSVTDFVRCANTAGSDCMQLLAPQFPATKRIHVCAAELDGMHKCFAHHLKDSKTARKKCEREFNAVASIDTVDVGALGCHVMEGHICR